MSSLGVRGRHQRVRARPARRGARRLRGQRLRGHVRARGLPAARRQPQPRPRALRLEEWLWYAAIEHGFRTLAGELAAAAQAASGDQLDRLRAILLRYVEVTAERPAHHPHHQPGRQRAPEAASTTCTSDTSARPTRWPTSCCVTWRPTGGPARFSPATLHFLVGHGAGGMVSLPALAGRFPGDGSTVTEQARDAVDVVLRGHRPSQTVRHVVDRPHSERRPRPAHRRHVRRAARRG